MSFRGGLNILINVLGCERGTGHGDGGGYEAKENLKVCGG